MKYLKVNDVKCGMRTAKPIYSENGVLMYGRNTTINESFMNNIEKLALYGLYILEPTEPLPPVSPEEEEFEKFQTVTCYALKKEIDALIAGKDFNISPIVESIIRGYGRLKKKISYLQTIRSNEDYPYKHSLSVAMLSAIICNRMNIEPKEQGYIVSAALLHDLGKLIAPAEIINKTGKLTSDELNVVREAEAKGFALVKNNYAISAGIRRYIMQMSIELNNKMTSYGETEQKLLVGTKILKVADRFDIFTAMRVYKEPMSGFSAIKFFQDNENEYDEKAVTALTESINILPVGACVLLTNGEKGLVLGESEYFLLRPKVLGFSSNTVYDLSQRKTYNEIQIKDILKTMDNRFVMSEEAGR